MTARRRFRFLHHTGRHAFVCAEVQLQPRDLWVGVYWRFSRFHGTITGSDSRHGRYIGRPWAVEIYVCLIPCVPVWVMLDRTIRPASGDRS